MERFLERVSLSEYRNNLILKGGVLISSMVGLDQRMTMDIDLTVRDLPLNAPAAKKIVGEIAEMEIGDNVSFSIKKVSFIMEGNESMGVRLSLDRTRIPLRMDLSTGDVITPGEVLYPYPLMLEHRTIPLWAYNIETVLTKAALNTRLRDFYDLTILQSMGPAFGTDTLKAALQATFQQRGTEGFLEKYQSILNEIEESSDMCKLWKSYQEKNPYAAGITWEMSLNAVRTLCDRILLTAR